MKKRCFRFLSLMLCVITIVSCLPISASATRAWDTIQSEIGKNAYGTKYLEDYGMSRKNIVNWLSSHENDNYYLGTVYVGGDFQSPNGDTSYNGTVGLNCAGFVAHACRKAGLNCSAIMNIMRQGDIAYWGSGRQYDALAGASNWYVLLQKSDIRAYVYYDVNSMLYGGHLEKGDIILSFADLPYGLGSGEDNHLMIYWGDYVGDNRCWQSSHANVIEPCAQLSYRRYIVIKASPEESMTLSKSSCKITIGSSYKLTATVTPSKLASNLKWSSSNTSVVKVNSKGQLSAVGKGTATITCKTSDGSLSKTCKVTVGGPKQVSFSAQSMDYNTIKLTWQTSSAVSGYRIYRATSSKGNYTLYKTYANKDRNYFYDKNLNFNKTYYYKVVPYLVYKNKIYEADMPDGQSCKTAIKKPSAKMTYTNGKLTLSWNAVTKAQYYEVWRSKYSSTKGYVLERTTTTPYFRRGNLDANTKYYYKIRAYKYVRGVKTYSSFSKVYELDTSNSKIEAYFP